MRARPKKIDFKGGDFILVCLVCKPRSNLPHFKHRPLVFPVRDDKETFSAVRTIYTGISRGSAQIARLPDQGQSSAADANPCGIVASRHGLSRFAPEEHQRNYALFLGHADKRLKTGPIASQY